MGDVKGVFLCHILGHWRVVFDSGLLSPKSSGKLCILEKKCGEKRDLLTSLQIPWWLLEAIVDLVSAITMAVQEESFWEAADISSLKDQGFTITIPRTDVKSKRNHNPPAVLTH